VKKVLSLISFIFLYNLILLLQNYTGEVYQIYLIGFRFNLFLIINLVLIYINRREVKNFLTELKLIGKFRDWSFAFLVPILITALVITLAYFLGKVEYNKPDFIIELAGTLLLDLPMYYLWNLPFLISVLILIRYFVGSVSSIRLLLFGLIFNLALVADKIFELNNTENLLAYYAVNAGLIFFNLFVFVSSKSFWVALLSILMSIYSYVIVMGSNNKFIIQTFFARRYESWEGIFSLSFTQQFLPEYLHGLLFVIFGLFFFILKNKI